MQILGIETSCDETGVAIYDTKLGLIYNRTKSQNGHKKYGGVVPENAAENHAQNITSMVKQALQYTKPTSINAVSYTAGPGLTGALLVGATFSCAFARA